MCQEIFATVVEFQKSWTDYVIALGTVAAVIAALTIAIWGDSLKSFTKRSKWIVDKQLLRHPQAGNIYLRLRITNEGYMSKDVTFTIEDIYDFDGKKAKRRPNYLPAPLRWTHNNTTARNIYHNEPALLDVCVLEPMQKLRIVSDPISSFSEFSELDHEKTVIKIAGAQENGQREIYYIKVERPDLSTVSAELCSEP